MSRGNLKFHQKEQNLSKSVHSVYIQLNNVIGQMKSVKSVSSRHLTSAPRWWSRSRWCPSRRHRGASFCTRRTSRSGETGFPLKSSERRTVEKQTKGIRRNKRQLLPFDISKGSSFAWNRTTRPSLKLVHLNFVEDDRCSIAQEKLFDAFESGLPDPDGPVGLIDVRVEDFRGQLMGPIQ